MLVTEGPRRPLYNFEAWDETPSQYLPSDSLLQKAMNAIYDGNGRGYDWLPSQLKPLYTQHVFSGPMFRHHNGIHRLQIEPYLVTSTASTRRQHAIHDSTVYDSAEEGVSTASTRRQHAIHGARYTTVLKKVFTRWWHSNIMLDHSRCYIRRYFADTFLQKAMNAIYDDDGEVMTGYLHS